MGLVNQHFAWNIFCRKKGLFLDKMAYFLDKTLFSHVRVYPLPLAERPASKTRNIINKKHLHETQHTFLVDHEKDVFFHSCESAMYIFFSFL